MANTGQELVLRISGDSASGQQAVSDLTSSLGSLGNALKAHGDAAQESAGNTSAFQKALEELLPSTSNVSGAFGDLKGTISDIWENPTEGLKGLASGLADDLGPALGSAGVAAALTAGALAAVGAAAYEAANKAAEYGENLMDTSEKTGMSVVAVSQWKGALEIAGGSIDQLSNGIFMFQRNMTQGTQTFSDGMQLIGLSIDDIKNLAPDQQFLTIATAIKNIDDPAQRAAAAMDLFGRQGRDLLPLMMKPLGDLVEESKALGSTWTEDEAKGAEEFEMQSRALKLELENMAVSIGRDLIPIMSAMLSGLKDAPGVIATVMDPLGIFRDSWHALGDAIGYASAAWDLFKGKAAEIPKVTGDAAQGVKAWTAAVNERALAAGPSLDQALAVEAGASKVLKDQLNDEIAARKALEAQIKAELAARLQNIDASEKEGQQAIAAVIKGLNDGQNVLLQMSETMGDSMLSGIVGPTATRADIIGQGVDQMGKTLEHQLNQVFTVTGLPDAQKTIAKALISDDPASPFMTTIDDALNNLPKLIEHGLTGGGGLSGAFQAVGSLIGKDIGGSIADSIAQSITENGGDAYSGIAGALLSSIPVVGSMIGPLISKLFSIGGPSQAELQGRQTESQFESSMGGWQGIQQALLAAGDSADVANAKIQQLWASEKQGSAAVQTVINSINADITAHTTDVSNAVTGVLTASQQLGSTFPSALKPMVDQLLALPGLTDQEKTSLSGMLTQNQPSFDQLVATAKNYGITLAALGPTFQEQQLSEQADTVVTDFTNLKNAGADVGGVLLGMSPKIGDLVKQAEQFGVALPTALQPLVQNLVDTGQLVDSTGTKITDVSNLKFADAGDPLTQGINNLQKTLQNLIDVLTNKIPAAAASAAQGIASSLGNVPVNIDARITTEGGPAVGVSRGGLVTARGVTYFDVGGFVPSGTDIIPAMLTPGEAVINAGAVSRIGSSAVQAINNGDGLLGGLTINGPIVDASGAFFPDRSSIEDLATMVAQALYDKVRGLAPLTLAGATA